MLFSQIKELVTLENVFSKKGRGPIIDKDLSIKKMQSVVVRNGKIMWTGKKEKLPKDFFKAKEILVNSNLYPGFIECHTHSAFLGDRKNEFELRNQGVSYQKIAEQGGGIQATVKATRQGTEKQIAHELHARLNTFLQQGVTTVEVKSGYGLDVKNEIKLLKAINKVSAEFNVIPTFLGAHAIASEYKTSTQHLLNMKELLKKIIDENLSRRIDIFIEKGYFSVNEGREYLLYAKELGFDLCVHADQLTRTGASRMAAQLGARSVEHSICINDKDIADLARSQTTCVLLPNADFYIHCPYPPARKMIDRGVRVALSTDFNPGSSPSQNVQLVGVLARLKMRMTLPEVFAAWTVGAAYALGLEAQKGGLLPHFDADFFSSDASWDAFFYDLKDHLIKNVWLGGKPKV